MDYNLYNRRLEIEQDENWDKVAEGMPFINFPPNWKIQIMPPFRGAMARFCVSIPLVKGFVSVYYDSMDRLGIFGEPYWEVYPYGEGDTARFAKDDIEGLLKGIQFSLSHIVNMENLENVK
jgi:hypothetical protein